MRKQVVVPRWLHVEPATPHAGHSAGTRFGGAVLGWPRGCGQPSLLCACLVTFSEGGVVCKSLPGGDVSTTWLPQDPRPPSWLQRPPPDPTHLGPWGRTGRCPAAQRCLIPQQAPVCGLGTVASVLLRPSLPQL